MTVGVGQSRQVDLLACAETFFYLLIRVLPETTREMAVWCDGDSTPGADRLKGVIIVR